MALDTKEKKKIGLLPACLIALVALVVGVGAGILGPQLILGGSLAGSSKSLGITTVAADQLSNTVIGTYTYNGVSHDITAQQVFDQTGTQSSSQQDDGSYALPSVDGALSYARNAIVQDYAQSQNISVSDDEVTQYAQDTLQTTDFSSIASSYGISEDSVKNLLKQSALIKKLHDQVVTTQVPDAPTAPTAPESGSEDTPTADYAQYIISLAGDEWDADANAWKSTDGAYATALADYQITNDSATYAAAQAAYYVAYQQYTAAQSQSSKEWTDFVNGLLKDSSITIYSLVS